MARDSVSLLGRSVNDPLVVDYLCFRDETQPFDAFAGGQTEISGDGLA